MLTVVKRGLYTAHETLILKRVGRLTPPDAEQVGQSLRQRRNMLRIVLIYISALAVWCASPLSWATPHKEWVQLTDCQYVEQTYNDGDSFHVQCGAQEFVARLYFVDAPESTLRYPERTREQSEYFGVTLDETLRAGRQATILVRERLQTPFVARTRWASAAGRKRPGNTFVEVDGHSLAALWSARGTDEGRHRRRAATHVTRFTGVRTHGPARQARHLGHVHRWTQRKPLHDGVVGSSERGTATQLTMPCSRLGTARDRRCLPSGGGTTTCSYGCRRVISRECRNTSSATSYVAREIVTGGLSIPTAGNTRSSA